MCGSRSAQRDDLWRGEPVIGMPRRGHVHSVPQQHLSVSISASSRWSSMPPASAHQCHISMPISATSMPDISAHLSCLSVSPFSASQCHLSMPVSATYQ
ncbi:unnamed protein product, partial [Staurois parvus]